MNDNRHALPPVSVTWQPHAGDHETRLGAFSPAHVERYEGGVDYERESDAGREGIR